MGKISNPFGMKDIEYNMFNFSKLIAFTFQRCLEHFLQFPNLVSYAANAYISIKSKKLSYCKILSFHHIILTSKDPKQVDF